MSNKANDRHNQIVHKDHYDFIQEHAFFQIWLHPKLSLTSNAHERMTLEYGILK